MCKGRPTAATQKGLPFPHLNLKEVAERERLIRELVGKFKPGGLDEYRSKEWARLNELIARTSSGCANYPTCCPKNTPEIVA